MKAAHSTLAPGNGARVASAATRSSLLARERVRLTDHQLAPARTTVRAMASVGSYARCRHETKAMTAQQTAAAT